MYKEVVKKAFEKAQEEIPGKTTKTNISEHISMILLNDFKVQISGRTLRNLIDDSNRVDDGEDISVHSEYVLALCKYLGFENYKAFLVENTKWHEPNNKAATFLKRNWIMLLVCIIAVLVSITSAIFNRERWMVWQDTKYVEVNFDVEKYHLNALKLYKEEQIAHFQKIIPNCETKYFNEDGSENVWYGKNKKGDLDFFSLFGKHPETGKFLKPITKYMIKKYICEDY